MAAHSKGEKIIDEIKNKIVQQIEGEKKKAINDANAEKNRIINKSQSDVKTIDERAGRNFSSAVEKVIKAFKNM